MTRTIAVAALGLMLSLGVLASACAPEEEQPPLGAPPADSSPQAEGARATPGVEGMPVSEQLSQEMDQLRDRLTQLEQNTPEAGDLVQMAERALQLIVEIDEEFRSMDPAAREQVLSEMSEISTLMARVTSRYGEQVETDPQPGAAPPPDYKAPTPEGTVTPVVGSRQTIAAVQELRTEIERMAVGEPAPDEIAVMFGRMGQLFQTMADQVATELAGDVETMVTEMAEAMAEMEEVVRAHIEQGG